jgi:hypothetical protein
MNPSDLIVLCALYLPIEQQIDILKWYCVADHEEVRHPSVRWWVTKHAPEVSNYLARPNAPR